MPLLSKCPRYNQASPSRLRDVSLALCTVDCTVEFVDKVLARLDTLCDMGKGHNGILLGS